MEGYEEVREWRVMKRRGNGGLRRGEGMEGYEEERMEGYEVEREWRVMKWRGNGGL